MISDDKHEDKAFMTLKENASGLRKNPLWNTSFLTRHVLCALFTTSISGNLPNPVATLLVSFL